jgi:predicted Zn-dependent protease
VSVLTGSERLGNMAGNAAAFFGLRYSRAQEYEADDLGLSYLRAAGYDPYAASDMLDALGRNEAFEARTRGHDEARSIPEWARTHPLTQNRIARARDAAAESGAGPDELPENELAYLRAVDGLLYGDDPEQGFVLGRAFAHPVMRIAFEAPSGFTLTNSPQAIMIDGPDGQRGEFAGAPMPPGGLEDYASILLSRILGEAQARPGAAQRTLVNGVPTLFVPVEVSTNQGAVPLSLAVYAGPGGGAFHFLMVSKPGSPPAAAIADLFSSFRLLTAEEAATLRPRRIRVVMPAPGDSARSLASLMASGNPLDHFLMLNGLAADEPLRPGQPVKIVALTGR